MTERQRDGGLRQAQTRGRRAEGAELQSDCLLATRSSLLAPLRDTLEFRSDRLEEARLAGAEGEKVDSGSETILEE
jgi:hypothetical protein